ncbi:hypothetical protein FJZ19_04690 [Candidatus Pacearchaeota archaeon]|nr:hypothetical protein [Candidatus Pacearchaeota archaeon]
MNKKKIKLTMLSSIAEDDLNHEYSEVLGFCRESCHKVLSFLWKGYQIRDYRQVGFSTNDQEFGIEIEEVCDYPKRLLGYLGFQGRNKNILCRLVGGDERLIRALSQPLDNIRGILSPHKRKAPIAEPELKDYINDWLFGLSLMSPLYQSIYRRKIRSKNIELVFLRKLKAMSNKERMDQSLKSLMEIWHTPRQNIEALREIISICLSKDVKKISRKDVDPFFYWSKDLEGRLAFHQQHQKK